MKTKFRENRKVSFSILLDFNPFAPEMQDVFSKVLYSPVTWVITESRAEQTACSKPCDLIPLEDKHFSLPPFPHKSNLKAATAVMISLEERSSAVLSGLPVGLVQEAAVQSQKKFLSLILSFLSFTFRAQV